MPGTFTTDLKVLNSAEVDNYLELGTFKFGTVLNDDYKIESGNAILFGATTPNDAIILASVGCTAVAIAAAGTGYTVGDVLTVVGGTTTEATQLLVLTITGGGGTGPIGTVEVSRPGTYSVNPTNPVSVTGGTGSSATFTLTYGNKDLTAGGVHIFAWVKLMAWPATAIKANGGIRITIAPDATPTLGFGVRTAVVAAGGTGYTLNDLLTGVSGTGTKATYRATAVSGGIVTQITLVTSGNYTLTPTSPDTTTGGTGANCTVTITILRSPTNGSNWFVGGNDQQTVEGWVNYVVDPNGTPDFVLGTPAINSIDRIGISELAAAATTNKAGTVCVDVIRIGTGSTIADGTGLAPADMTSYAAFDIANARAWGIAVKQAGIFFINGKINIGTTTQAAETIFIDTSLVLVYSDMPVASGFYELKVQGVSGQETTFRLGKYVPLTGLTSLGCTIKGAGYTAASSRSDGVLGFAHSFWKLTASAANQITQLYGSAFSEMLSMALTYNTVSPTVASCTTSNGSPTMTTSGSFSTAGIVVGMSITGTNIPAGTSVKSIESATSLTMDKNATGNIGGTATFSQSSEVRGCVFVNSGAVTTGGCLFDKCTFQDLKTTAPISATYAMIVASTTEMSRVTNCTFINCNKAIQLSSASDGTYAFVGIKFSGNSFDVRVEAITGTVTINVSGGGDTPTVESAGATIVIVNAVTVKITTLDAADSTAIQNARVVLYATTGTTVTITRSGTTATVAHTGHGYLTGQKVNILGANEGQYNGVKSITFINANSYSYTVTGSPATPATGTIKSHRVILDGLTDSDGIIQDTGFPFVSNLVVTGRARKGSASTFYKTAVIAGTITSTGFTTTSFLVQDS